MLERFQATPYLDLSDYSNDIGVRSLHVGPDGELFVLAMAREHHEMLLKEEPIKEGIDYKILRYDGSRLKTCEVKSQTWYTFVQPLPGDELMLVDSRAWCESPDEYTLNARVFTSTGILKREFLLGDGIQTLQATSDGRIWVGYFDEGIFGNNGWDFSPMGIIGGAGLILWDQNIKRKYFYKQPEGINGIWDCEAINASSDNEVWCYYYCGYHPLIRIRDEKITGTWRTPVCGSDGFIIWKDWALFRGGYSPENYRDRYYVFQLSDDMMSIGDVFQLTGVNSDLIRTDILAARGNLMYLYHRNWVYRVDLRDVVASGIAERKKD